MLEQNTLHTELLPEISNSGEAFTEGQSGGASVENRNDAGLFTEEELVINEILSLSPDEMTPLEALQRLALWRKRLMNQ